MLGKLMKYELRATARWFLPLYGALLLFAGINRLFWSFSWGSQVDDYRVSILVERFADIPRVMAAMAYGCIIVAIMVITFVVMIQRFYKNLMGDEGYLMFTLPVTPAANILNKLLVSVFWVLISIVVTILSVFLLTVNTEFFREFPRVFGMIAREIRTEAGVQLTVFLAQLAVLMLVCIVTGILHVYVSIAIGQLANSHKALLSIGAYIGINLVVEVVSSVASLLLFLGRNVVYDMYDAVWFLNGTMLLAILLNVAFGVIYFIVTQQVLTKKLNLE